MTTPEQQARDMVDAAVLSKEDRMKYIDAAVKEVRGPQC